LLFPRSAWSASPPSYTAYPAARVKDSLTRRLPR
jgi:hypothetical protein